MANGRIERWITTDEGNHLPIIDGKISGGEKSTKRTAESLFVEGLTGKKPEEHKKSLFAKGITGKKPEEKKLEKLSNKKLLVDFVKKQTDIDLEKYIEPRAKNSRTGLSVHLEKIPRNGRMQVIDVLNKYGRKMRVEDNGGYGDFIYFEK